MFQLIILLLASTVIFFRRISAFPLRNWDEAWYAEAVKNMASGNYGYIMQFWNGRYYFDHSPLYFWLSTPFFKIFGAGEWQARIVAATAAVFCIVLIFLIGKKIKNQTAGFISAIVFLTTGGTVIRFAHGNLDSLLIFLLLASFYFYLCSSKKLFFSVLSGLLIGLGILVKSWGSGLLPLFLIVVYSRLIDKKPPIRFPVIIVSAMATFLWWYVLGIFNFGNEFIRWFILNPSEGRLGTPIGNFSLDYYKFALDDIGFWIVVPIIYFLFKKRVRFTEDYFVLPFFFVAFVYITVLNFLSDKSDWYLIPAYPLLALIIGNFGSRMIESKKMLFGTLISLLIIVGWWNVLRVENTYPDRSIIGAELGTKAREIIPLDDEVILEDNDFTSFLYYSNQNHIFTLQNHKKPNEWWILLPDELNNFLARNQKTWIITRSPEKYKTFKEREAVYGYSFMKNY